MERMQYRPQLEQVSYLQPVPVSIEQNFLDEPINFIDAKVRRLTKDIYQSGERRDPEALARCYELLGNAFEKLALDGFPQETVNDENDVLKRINLLNIIRADCKLTFPNMKFDSGFGIDVDRLITLEAKELMDKKNFSQEERNNGWLRFKESRLLDVQTLLGEMYKVHDKTTKYTLRDGKLYFDALSKTKPFDETMAFFVALSLSDGTNELPRLLEEFYEYVKIGIWAQKAEEGEQYAMASSEGIAEGTRYTNNYVDVGTKRYDSNTREAYVEVTRFKSAVSHEAYLAIFLKEDPTYLDHREHLPIDAALFKSITFEKNRFRSQHDLYNEVFSRHPDAMDENVFLHEIYVKCIPVITEYIERLCNFTSWKDLGDAYDAVIKASYQHYLAYMTNKDLRDINSYGTLTISAYDESVRAGAVIVQQYTHMEGVAISSGCGSVSTLGNAYGAEAILQSQSLENLIEYQTVAAFLNNTPGQINSELSDSKGPRLVPCPACGHINLRPKEGLITDGCKGPKCTDRDAIGCGQKPVEEKKAEKNPVIEDIFMLNSEENTPPPAEEDDGKVIFINLARFNRLEEDDDEEDEAA